MMDAALINRLIDQGAGVIVVIVIVYALVKLAMYFGKPFLEAQKQQAQAMLAQAQSMKTQADCMGQMKDSVREFVSRDNNDHREILLSLQVVIKEVQQLSTEVKAQGEIIQGVCKEAGLVKPSGAVARLV